MFEGTFTSLSGKVHGLYRIDSACKTATPYCGAVAMNRYDETCDTSNTDAVTCKLCRNTTEFRKDEKELKDCQAFLTQVMEPPAPTVRNRVTMTAAVARVTISQDGKPVIELQNVNVQIGHDTK
jgi:hypothetical protein